MALGIPSVEIPQKPHLSNPVGGGQTITLAVKAVFIFPMAVFISPMAVFISPLAVLQRMAVLV